MLTVALERFHDHEVIVKALICARVECWFVVVAALSLDDRPFAG
jgi:hypothetical protein